MVPAGGEPHQASIPFQFVFRGSRVLEERATAYSDERDRTHDKSVVVYALDAGDHQLTRFSPSLYED